MKKTILLSPLLLSLFACQKNSPEVTPSDSRNSSIAHSSDSLTKWTRNIQENFRDLGETTNYTDKNNLKQGKGIVIELGKGMTTEFYKDGKLVEGC